MLKKMITLFILVLCCFSWTFSVLGAEYHDVAHDKWYYEDVMLAKRSGIVVGKDEYKFEPDSKLKIAEAIVTVSKVYSKISGEEIVHGVEDKWYTPYIRYAELNHLIKDGQFQDYELNITRLQYAMLCYNVVQKQDNALLNSIQKIPDMQNTDYGYQEVEALYNIGIMVGSDEYGTFNPYEELTRAQMTVALNRILYPERRVSKEFVTDEMVRYTSFKEVVVNQESVLNKIFVSCDNYVVASEKLDKLQAEINKFGGVCGFYMVTLDGKFSVGYNIDQRIPSASTVKAPFSLYSMKQIESGNGTLDEIVTYEKKHYSAGSGVIKNSQYGTKYSLEQVFHNTINISDNSGYYMLQDRFKISGYNEFLDSIGCSRMKLVGGIKWGYIYPREAALIWNEIYNYSKTSEYGQKLFDMFVNAKYNFIKDAYVSKYSTLDYEIAHKSGFNKDGRHDEAIVLLNDIPYFITITTKPQENGGDRTYLKNTALTLEEIMKDYIACVTKE